MSATASRPTEQARGVLGQAISDGLLVAWRNLKRIPRIPELAIFAILQSIMFVLLFAFVFGGAIPIPGYENVPNAYREFLMPGIFGQTIVFAAATTAIGMADDTHKGIIDRFRSLPMARSAVLSGRALSDVVYNGGILIVLILSGLAVGWTVHTGFPALLAGVGLMLLFAFAMSWLGIWIGPQRAVGRGRPAGDLHGAVPDHVRLERVRAAADAARLAPAGRRMEPDQHPDRRPPRAVGQSEPVRLGQLPLAEPGPGDGGLGRGDRRDLRAVGCPPLPLDEPLRDK